MRIALTSILLPRSIITHCGCSESSSPVKVLVRYGLLFQYELGSPSVRRDQPFPSPRLNPRCGSGVGPRMPDFVAWLGAASEVALLLVCVAPGATRIPVPGLDHQFGVLTIGHSLPSRVEDDAEH